MKLVTQTHAGQVIGVAPRTIRAWISKGFITKHDKAKVDLEEVVSYNKFRKSDPTYRNVSIANKKRFKKLIPEASEDGQQQPDQQPQNPNNTDEDPTIDIEGIVTSQYSHENYNKVKLHKEAFLAKSAELKYRKDMGELIELHEAKEVSGQVFEILNKALDNLPIALKGKNDNVPNDVVEDLFAMINDLKEDLQRSIRRMKW